MEFEKLTGIVIVIWVFGIIFNLCLVGGLIWVVCHFVSKYW